MRYAVASTIGGATGGALLLLTPARLFAHAIPVLMLVATVLFIVAPRLVGAAQQHAAHGGPIDKTRTLRLRTFAQFAASVMVGYFNAGSGIIVMASLSLCGVREIQLLNGFKNLLGAMAAGAAIAALALGGQVAWTAAALMMTGSVVGGLSGARIAQRIDAKLLRALTLVFSLVMTGYFFWKFWS